MNRCTSRRKGAKTGSVCCALEAGHKGEHAYVEEPHRRKHGTSDHHRNRLEHGRDAVPAAHARRVLTITNQKENHDQ